VAAIVALVATAAALPGAAAGPRTPTSARPDPHVSMQERGSLARPRITRLEVLTRSAQVAEDPPGAPGDTWGGQQSRIVRRGDGSLLAVYLTSPDGITDPSRAQWVLMRRGPRATDRWVELARRRAGREPMHLVGGAGNTAYVVSWPRRPRVWTVQGDRVGPVERVPGDWEVMQGSSTPYSGVGVGRDGRLCLVGARSDRGTKPGSPYTSDAGWDLACRDPGGHWSRLRRVPVGLRFCYPFVHVRAGGGVDLIGTRDVTWEAVGYPQVPGEFGYLFDAVDRWQLDSPRDQHPTRTRLGRMPFVEPASHAPLYWQSDSMIDRRGRLHVLIQSQTTSGGYRMEHLRVDGDGTVRRRTVRAGGYTDGALRLLEDARGRLLLLFVQSDAVFVFTTSHGGMRLERRVDLTERLTGGRRVVGPAFVTSVRGGTPRSDAVDLLLPLRGKAGTIVTTYARLRLP
jgi:hypothetical protein